MRFGKNLHYAPIVPFFSPLTKCGHTAWSYRDTHVRKQADSQSQATVSVHSRSALRLCSRACKMSSDCNFTRAREWHLPFDGDVGTLSVCFMCLRGAQV